MGSRDFSPVVRRDSLPDGPALSVLMPRAGDMLTDGMDVGLHARALSYLYLSETRSSFAIERDIPASDRQARVGPCACGRGRDGDGAARQRRLPLL